jgi:hypothetical protein
MLLVLDPEGFLYEIIPSRRRCVNHFLAGGALLHALRRSHLLLR